MYLTSNNIHQHFDRYRFQKKLGLPVTLVIDAYQCTFKNQKKKDKTFVCISKANRKISSREFQVAGGGRPTCIQQTSVIRLNSFLILSATIIDHF